MTVETPQIWVEEEKNTISFIREARQNPLAVDGQVVFDEILYIDIRSPGATSVMRHEVDRVRPDGTTRRNEAMYKRFGKYIEEYKAKNGAVVNSGTPIAEWAMVNAARAAHLKYIGILSIEQLAEVPDGQLGNIGLDGLELRRKAKDWLASAKNSKAAVEAKAEARRLQDQIDDIKAQLDALADAVNEELDEDHKKKIRTSYAKKIKPVKQTAA